MALRRRGKEYLTYLKQGLESNSSAGGPVIPYSTWRRWLVQGKITERRLLQLGINPYGYGPRKRKTVTGTRNIHALAAQSSLPPHHQRNVPAQNNEHSTTSEQVAASSSCQPGVSSPLILQQHDSLSTPSTSYENISNDCLLEKGSNTSLSSVSDEQGLCESTSSTSSSLLEISSDSIVSDSDCSFSNVSEGSSKSKKEQKRISSVLESKKIGVDVLNQPLSDSLSVTKFETLLMIYHLAMRHSLTDTFLEDQIKFVNQLVGVPDAIPGSKWLFQKLFMFGSRPTVHFFCPNCSEYLGPESLFKTESVTCRNCEWLQTASSLNNGHYFVTLSIKDQLKTLLSRPNLKLVSRDEHVDGVVSDMFDGEIYQSLTEQGNFMSNPNSLSITISTDGAPVFKSSSNSLYPIHFHLNEVSAEQRFDVENMLLAGLWFTKIGEPNLQIFLKPLMEELSTLKTNGVVWRKPDGSLVESPVFLLSCCTDTVARPKVQNMQQFNGRYGCSYCLHPNLPIVVNEVVKPSSGIRIVHEQNIFSDSEESDGERREKNSTPRQLIKQKKTYRYLADTVYPLRTDKRLRKLMKLAGSSHLDHIYGVKGNCVLTMSPALDLVFGVPLDYLHLVLSGCVKRLANLWFDSTSNGQPYYIGLLIHIVDQKLSHISLPSNMASPRPMSERCHWKAKEWRGFLLYYGLPCISQILPEPFYSHFKKLSTAIFILTKRSVVYDEVDEANLLLNSFVREYQQLYGEKNMVFNVHALQHLGVQVAKLGPLWAYSMFPFEGANGRLLKIVKGTKSVATQIARKFLMTQQVCKLLQGNYAVKDEVIEFCSSVVEYRYAKHHNKFGSITALGRTTVIELSIEQMDVFEMAGINIGHVVQVYNRACMNGSVFSSRQLGRQKLSNDSCVRLTDGSFALIDLIVAVSNDIAESDLYCLAREVNIALNPSHCMPPQIKQCSLDPFGVVCAFPFIDIAGKCIFVTCDDKFFVAEFSNTIEKS